MALLDPQIDEFLKSSDSLLDDSDLPDEHHQIVERESELLEKRWNKVKNDANLREPRFVYTMKVHFKELRLSLCTLKTVSSSSFEIRVNLLHH